MRKRVDVCVSYSISERGSSSSEVRAPCGCDVGRDGGATLQRHFGTAARKVRVFSTLAIYIYRFSFRY